LHDANDRLGDLTRTHFESLSQLEDYTEKGHSSILYLLAESHGFKGNEQLDYMASHIGVSSGLVTLIRGIPFHATTSQCYIPADLMIKYDLSAKNISSDVNKSNIALRDVVYEIGSQAFGHLEKAGDIGRSHEASIPADVIYAIYPAIYTSIMLDELRKVDFDPYAFVLSLQSPKITLRLQWALFKSHTLKTRWA
jgi:phytoene/squalene synthetase